MLHAARQLPSWLIFDVGEKAMSRSRRIVASLSLAFGILLALPALLFFASPVFAVFDLQEPVGWQVVSALYFYSIAVVVPAALLILHACVVGWQSARVAKVALALLLGRPFLGGIVGVGRYVYESVVHFKKPA